MNDFLRLNPKVYTRTSGGFNMSQRALTRHSMSALPGMLSFVLVLSAIGCSSLVSSGVVERSDRPEYWGGYVPFATYELLMDLFIVSQDPEMTSILSAPDNDTYHEFSTRGVPSSINKYLENPGRYPRIKGVMDRGTKLKCIRIFAYESEDLRNVRSVIARVLDGPFAGQEVELTPVSIEVYGAQITGAIMVRRPNKLMLKLCDAPTAGVAP